MLGGLSASVLLQGLALVWLGPPCEASPLGLTVHVVPLESEGGEMVRAHFTAVASSPCPPLTGLCAAGDDCLLHPASLPFTGTRPDPGWCVRQWQKTVPSNYQATISLGPSTEFYVSMTAGPHVRANSGRLNHPAFVALPPPLRARVNCPHHFHLAVKDLDGDRVRCRFARADRGECVHCTRHSFIELEQDKCMLTFTGRAPAGRYLIFLMAEDLIPVPKTRNAPDLQPLSSVPVHLSLTVEAASSSCAAEPVAAGDTPGHGSTLFVLPYQEVEFDVDFDSELESVLEMAVVGPPGLFRVGFRSVGPLSASRVAWVRAQNKLSPLLPVCFAANTQSLQSEPRCVWLYQRGTRTLPAGTELRCGRTEMTLVLPVASLSDIDVAELQLNSPACPVGHNGTHLTAHIDLNGCGTEAVHAGSELIYTNTLQTVRPYTTVSRRPSLILPLACRIPGIQAAGPHYAILIPTEREAFGEVALWIEVHPPGEGPLAKYTRLPRFRSRRPARVRRGAPSWRNGTLSTTPGSPAGDRHSHLDLHVMSNCSVHRAEMIVSNCIESETEDFAVYNPILQQGCTATNDTLEVVTSRNNSRVYRLDLSNMTTRASTMYIKCTANLCIATLPSDKCPDLCGSSASQRMLLNSVFTRSYTIESGPISLLVDGPDLTAAAPAETTAAPVAPAAAATATAAAAAATATAAAQAATSSHAPERMSAAAAAVVMWTAAGVLLRHGFLEQAG